MKFFGGIKCFCSGNCSIYISGRSFCVSLKNTMPFVLSFKTTSYLLLSTLKSINYSYFCNTLAGLSKTTNLASSSYSFCFFSSSSFFYFSIYSFCSSSYFFCCAFYSIIDTFYYLRASTFLVVLNTTGANFSFFSSLTYVL